jgi:hypothetical protein
MFKLSVSREQLEMLKQGLVDYRTVDGKIAPDDSMTLAFNALVAKVDKTLDAAAQDGNDCQACGEFGPSHNGASHCKSGSIASGGTRAHCSCDACF